VTQAYEPGLPQTCRPPGMFWFFAVMLTGGLERLHDIVDAGVDTCRRTPGYEWELASALQLRANVFANFTASARAATRGAGEALESSRRLGDDWGTAEAFSARAESWERKGEYRSAALDYEAAIESAERIGARAQVAVLNARLGMALIEMGETERGEG